MGEPTKDLRFNSVSCYAHTWSNLAVLFLLMTTTGHYASMAGTLDEKLEFDRSVVEQEALFAAEICI